MCHVEISVHEFENFIPAQCDMYGSKCYNLCSKAFNVFNLKNNVKYYFKIIPIGNFRTFISKTSYQLQSLLFII